ncbi:TetR/AcrR family transcriptional regulator [Embleya sp. NBC_00896]|uniref:TetR/AcrR family transcriptional regulator n=1 Tax=Embleya sp. NBC_00896 TaxID=2975961 RepID=UPI002F91BCB4|nr:TetR/AcrR family transcriptional regulator [Embleya sp. NBC_00896]
MGSTAVPGVRRRADAQRNIDTILAAALDAFARDPEVTMTDIARAAGVGRVTLYGHFASRDVLLAASITKVLGDVNAVLDAADLATGTATEALARLTGGAWQVLDRCRGLRLAALKGLGEESLRRHHAQVLGRLEEVIVRGRAEGDIRTDLPLPWLTATYYGLIHAAADEVDAGRLDRAAAGDTVATTLLAAFAVPADRR